MRHLALAALVALCAPAALAQASHDTLADAIASALSDNPSLLAQQRSRSEADETLEQAKSQARPQLSLRGSFGTQQQEIGRTFTINGFTFPLDGVSQKDSLGFEARQTLYAGGALTALRKQAEQGVKGAEAQLQSFQQTLILDVVEAFLDVRRADAEVDIRTTNVNSLKQQVQAASDRFTVGDVTRTDVAQAQARAAGSESDLAAAKARLANARATYERIVGRPPLQLADPPPAPPTPESADAAIAIATTDSQQLIAARAAEEAASHGVDVARGATLPKVGLVGSAGLQDTYQDGRFRDTNVGVSAEVSIPIYQGGQLSSKTRASKMEADRLHFERLAAERSVTAQVRSAWNSLLAAREATQASRSHVTAAEIALEGAGQELQVGTRITLDVLDQERELLEARLGLIDSERASYLAAVQLLAAIGRLKPELFGR